MKNGLFRFFFHIIYGVVFFSDSCAAGEFFQSFLLGESARKWRRAGDFWETVSHVMKVKRILEQPDLGNCSTEVSCCGHTP